MKKSIAIPLTVSIIAISFSAIFVKWSSAPAPILSMYRMWFACILMLPIVWAKREEFRRIGRKEARLLIFSGLFLAMHFALWFESLKLTTVASSTIILALQPLVSLIAGFIFFKERTTRAAIFALAVATFGVMMIGWGDFGLSAQAIRGDLLSFLCVIAVVGYLFIGQNAVKKVSHWIYSFCVFLSAAVFLTLFNLATSQEFFAYPAKEWGVFALLAVVPTMSHIINNWLLNYVNATTISMSILGEPVGASLLAVWLLGEHMTWLQIVGGVLVLAGMFLFLIRQSAAARPASGKSSDAPARTAETP
ncbi:DMT family transporter [Saccharibacillus alkalitolerans]|uniref:DMT family transporter n=1 Tax=Saccharibacillus alkalitolerans TaxID=2705290 RepID=A0ABX0FCF7_9BACL|nr:DMT family transporter [Saccharibacillus alkalitolerans]NGZ77649.1 DMT family transporter [Saccharibacillus alkalitolerans]